MTNDGDLAHSLMHPYHEMPKTYLAKVKGIIEDKAIEKLRKGVKLREGLTAPATVNKLKKTDANSWVEITVHEGRYRQVRRMLEEGGYPEIKLIRVTYGSLALGNVPLGKYRHMTPDEIKRLKSEAAGIVKSKKKA